MRKKRRPDGRLCSEQQNLVSCMAVNDCFQYSQRSSGFYLADSQAFKISNRKPIPTQLIAVIQCSWKVGSLGRNAFEALAEESP